MICLRKEMKRGKSEFTQSGKIVRRLTALDAHVYVAHRVLSPDVHTQIVRILEIFITNIARQLHLVRIFLVRFQLVHGRKIHQTAIAPVNQSAIGSWFGINYRNLITLKHHTTYLVICVSSYHGQQYVSRNKFCSCISYGNTCMHTFFLGAWPLWERGA